MPQMRGNALLPLHAKAMLIPFSCVLTVHHASATHLGHSSTPGTTLAATVSDVVMSIPVSQ